MLLHRAVAVEGRARDAGTVLALGRTAVVLAGEDVDRLAVLELEDAVDLPAVRQSLRSVREGRNLVVEICGEVVSDVIVRVAPVTGQIDRVLRDGVKDAGVVQIVAPGIGELAGKPVPGTAASA